LQPISSNNIELSFCECYSCEQALEVHIEKASNKKFGRKKGRVRFRDYYAQVGNLCSVEYRSNKKKENYSKNWYNNDNTKWIVMVECVCIFDRSQKVFLDDFGENILTA